MKMYEKGGEGGDRVLSRMTVQQYLLFPKYFNVRFLEFLKGHIFLIYKQINTHTRILNKENLINLQYYCLRKYTTYSSKNSTCKMEKCSIGRGLQNTCHSNKAVIIYVQNVLICLFGIFTNDI